MKYKPSAGREVRVYKNLPKGWRVTTGATTNPVGTVWINSGGSILSRKNGKKPRRSALLVIDEEAMTEKIASKRLAGKEDYFITDETSERKIQSAVRRLKKEKARK